METTKNERRWERTNVTNLLRNRQSGTYYARVKVNGKQKWRTLDTTVFTVAKLRVADVEKAIRAQALAANGDIYSGPEQETHVARFIAAYCSQLDHNLTLAPSTKARAKDSVKTLIKTWPELPSRDVRRLTTSDCQAWATFAHKESIRIAAPNARTKRTGMSASGFNKCLDALRAILEIAREKGMLYANPAADVSKVSGEGKPLNLPANAQFNKIIALMAKSGSRWSRDAAHLAQLLAYTGARLREGTNLEWRHLDKAKNLLTIPGTKSESSKDRLLPLSTALAALLKAIRIRYNSEEQKRKRANSDSERPASYIARVKSCAATLKAACRKIGVDEIGHHDLRHLFATRCIESGVDIPTVAKWLGHSDGGVLAMKVYGHLRQEHSLAQAKKIVF